MADPREKQYCVWQGKRQCNGQRVTIGNLTIRIPSRPAASQTGHGVFAVFSCLLAVLTMQSIGMAAGTAHGVPNHAVAGAPGIARALQPQNGLSEQISRWVRAYRRLLMHRESGGTAGQISSVGFGIEVPSRVGRTDMNPAGPHGLMIHAMLLNAMQFPCVPFAHSRPGKSTAAPTFSSDHRSKASRETAHIRFLGQLAPPAAKTTL